MTPKCKKLDCQFPALELSGEMVDGYCKQHHEQFIRLLTIMAIDR